MTLTAPNGRDHGMAGQDERPTFVLVGGVPGAGKSTLLASIGDSTARTLDPDTYRRSFARVLPDAPYRSYRLLVHLLHAAATLAGIVLGPLRPTPATLMVHNPATRRKRRDLVGRFARQCGWRTILVLVDVDRAQALEGQHRRGRVINSESFERHWQRWSTDHDLIEAVARGENPLPDWDQVYVIDRDNGASAIDQLLRSTS